MTINYRAIIKILRNEKFHEVLQYLLHRQNNNKLYYSVNKLMELCALNRNKVYYLLSRIEESGIEVDIIKMETSEQVQTEIFKTSIADLMFRTNEVDNRESTRKRTLFSINPEAFKFKIQIPLLDKVEKSHISSIGELNLGRVSLKDSKLQQILEFIVKEPNYEFLSILISAYHGMVIENIEHQYDEMSLDDYRFLAQLLTKTPTNISIKELTNMGLVQSSYHPEVKFAPLVDTISFELCSDFEADLKVETIGDRQIVI